ncbi:uncharacterized protein ColSpa_09273 [Colletotrichum spaethianum]|uniref:Uncharacterized protein n=1 Tax=Colletotrichum spaethianum TaxID=700344 RepID=A0AA37PBD0_9PEZI|nr:uncharacterized protein ColSpa_09273 [Colletotrichum spaethianum]GKT49092.1 hypothetical protein ColSpa_09273 [Colletotrichum spaethianum]
MVSSRHIHWAEGGVSNFDAYLPTALVVHISLTKTLLEKHGETIVAYAGSTRHITDLLELTAQGSGRFPTLKLDEVLALPEMRDGEGVMSDYTVAGWRPADALLKRFGGVCWVIEMDHLGVPFCRAYADGLQRGKARCSDFLLGLDEVIGCGKRHTTAGEALATLDQHRVDPADYKCYVDIR